MKFFQPVLLTFMLGMSKSASAADYAATSGSAVSTGAVAAAPAAPSAASVVSNTPAITATTNLATSASTNYESSSAWNPLAGVPPLPPSVPATQYSDAGTVTVLQGPLDGGYAAGPAAVSVHTTSTTYGGGAGGDYGVDVGSGAGYGGQNGGNGGAFVSSSISTSGSGYGGSQGGGSFGRSTGGYGGQSVGFAGNGASGSGGYGGQGGVAIGGDNGGSGGYGGQSSGGFQQIGGGGGAGDYNQQDNGEGDNGDDGDDFGDDEGVAIGDGNGVGGGAGGDYGADIGAQGGDYAAKPVLIAKVTGGNGGGGYGGGNGGGGYGGGNGGGYGGGCGNGGCGGGVALPVAQPIAKAPVQVAAPVDIPIKSTMPVFKPVPIYPVRTAYRHSTPYVSGTLSKYPVGTGFQTGRVVPYPSKKSVYYGPFRFSRPRIHAKPVQVPSLDLSALLGGLTSGAGLSALASGGLSLDKLAPLMPLVEAFAKNLPIPALQMGDNGAAIQALLQTLAQIPLPSVQVNIPTHGPSAATLLSQLLSVGEKLSPTIKLDGAALGNLGNLAGLGNIAGLSGGLNLGGLGHGLSGLSLPAIKIDTSSHGQGLNLGSLAPLALPALSLPSLSLGHSGGLSLSGLANIASSGLSGLSSGVGVGHGISLKPIPVPQVAPLTGPSVSLIKSLPVLGKLKLPEIPSIPSIMQAFSFHTLTDMFGGLPRLSLTKKETPKMTIPIPVPVPKRIVSAFPMKRGPLTGHVVVEDFPYGRQQYGVYDEPCNDRVKGLPLAVGKGGVGY